MVALVKGKIERVSQDGAPAVLTLESEHTRSGSFHLLLNGVSVGEIHGPTKDQYRQSLKELCGAPVITGYRDGTMSQEGADHTRGTSTTAPTQTSAHPDTG